MVLGGGLMGWLTALLTVAVLPVAGDRGQILGILAIGYPIFFLTVAITWNWLYERRHPTPD